MKILITGGYGFIGSHVADRFYKEGHHVYIIDNLSNGSVENVEVPHKFFNLDIASRKCNEIFKAIRFDIVINLSAQVDVNTSLESPYLDSKSNILGITNMLDLSHKYGVKKFIFASSAAVYGNTEILPVTENVDLNPISPYGMSKNVGEFYCKKWFEIYGLKTICFRFSNVFGPKQGLKGESGVISIFMDRVIKGEAITIFGDGNQTRDFIYVEDLVDAIYKSVENNFHGILNLSSNTQNSLNELLDILRKLHPINKICYKESRLGDIKDSRLDNTKVKEILGWNTKYTFEEGIEKTYKWYKANYETQNNKTITKIVSPRRQFLKSTMLKLIPYIENFLVVVLIAFLSIRTFNYKTSLYGSSIDLCYIYIILFAVIYGMKQAFISITLSSIMYIYLFLYYGKDIITFIYDPKYLFHITFYIIIGSTIGYSIDSKKRKIDSNQLEIESINEKYELLDVIYNETRTIKEELQNQIMNYEDSFGSIYSTTKALDSLRLDEIYPNAISIVETLLNTSMVSIYSLSKDGNFLRLKAKSSNKNFNLPFSIKADEYIEIKNAIINKNCFVNKTLIPDLPIMVAPVNEGNKIVAIIAIHEFKFENLTLYYQNLFIVITNLISSSISKAYKYDEATLKEKYLPNTEILTNKEFRITLKNKIENGNALSMDFTLIRTKNDNYSYEEMFHRISTGIRDTDIIGLGSDNYFYVILSNSDNISAKKVIERLSFNGVQFEIVEVVTENV